MKSKLRASQGMVDYFKKEQETILEDKIALPQKEPINHEELKQRLEKYSERFYNKDNELVEDKQETLEEAKEMEKQKANDLLISKAPEMLEMLKRLIQPDLDILDLIEAEKLIKEATQQERLEIEFQKWHNKKEPINHKDANLNYIIPKQETLEEAKSKFCNDSNNWQGSSREDLKLGWDACAKWQQEQDKKLYSEEDVYYTLEHAMKDAPIEGLTYHYDWDFRNLKEWFKQFKKK
jgi:exonuclease VII large subunit